MMNFFRRLFDRKKTDSRQTPTTIFEHRLTSSALTFPPVPVPLLHFDEIIKLHPEIQAIKHASANKKDLESAGGKAFEGVFQDNLLFTKLIKAKVSGNVLVGLVGDTGIIGDTGQENLLNSAYPSIMLQAYSLEAILRQVAARFHEQRADLLAQGGDNYGNRENWIEAIREYIQALQIAPDEPITYMSLGVVAAKAGYIDQGVVYLKKALELSPASERIKRNLRAVEEIATSK